jgi:hypothetical protein
MSPAITGIAVSSALVRSCSKIGPDGPEPGQAVEAGTCGQAGTSLASPLLAGVIADADVCLTVLLGRLRCCR